MNTATTTPSTAHEFTPKQWRWQGFMRSRQHHVISAALGILGILLLVLGSYGFGHRIHVHDSVIIPTFLAFYFAIMRRADITDYCRQHHNPRGELRPDAPPLWPSKWATTWAPAASTTCFLIAATAISMEGILWTFTPTETTLSLQFVSGLGLLALGFGIWSVGAFSARECLHTHEHPGSVRR